MEEEVQKLWTLSKAKRIQNLNYVIGVELQTLYHLVQGKNFTDDFEDLLISLISINNGGLSVQNAHILALVSVSYYKSQEHPNYWKILPFLTEEIQKCRKPSIYILGFLSKKMCDGFKSQLPAPVQFLLKTSNEDLFPLICQFFRRVLKGTGSFLNNLIQDIFGFVFSVSSSTNKELKIQAIKTIPSLLMCGNVSIKKLLPIIEQFLSLDSKEIRYACAKSLAKVVSLGFFEQTEQKNDNPFKYYLSTILQFARNEKNVGTLGLTMCIYMRYNNPIEIVKRLRGFAKFSLALSTLSLSLPALVFLSNSNFYSIISVVGSTAGNSLCNHLLDLLSKENLTISNALVVLSALNNLQVSSRTIAIAAKRFYPLLSSGGNNSKTVKYLQGAQREDYSIIKKACISLFSKIGKQDVNLSKIFIDTFTSFLVTVDDSKESDIDGFSKAAAAIILSIPNYSYIDNSIFSQASIEKIKSLIKVTLDTNKSGVKIAISYLLLAALYKKKEGNELIPKAFNYIQSFLTSFSKLSRNELIQNKLIIRKKIKFMSCYLISIGNSPPKNFEKLKPTINGFVLILVPFFTSLTKNGQIAFLQLAKLLDFNQKIVDKVTKSIVFTYPYLLNVSHINDEIIDTVSPDIGEAFYNFKIPNSNPEQIQFLSLVDFFCDFNNSQKELTFPSSSELIIHSKTILQILPYWISKCSATVLNGIIPSLFEYAKLNLTEVISKLQILSVILQSKREIEIPSSFFNKMLILETVPNHLLEYELGKTIGAWISFNKNIDFSKLNKNDKLLSIILLFCSRNIDSNFLIQSFFILSQKIQKESQNTFSTNLKSNSIINNKFILFGLNNIISSLKSIPEFSVHISNFLEELSFTDVIRDYSFLKGFSNCSLNTKEKLTQIQIQRIGFNLSHFSALNLYAKLNGLLITKTISNPNLDIQSPLPLLTSLLSNINISINHAPLLFMMLQQSSSISKPNNNENQIESYILKLFEEYPDVKFWTDYSKRIVINGCVPPAEPIGDTRIAPTSNVLICAIKITVLLVAKIRSTMDLNCVDDIVSIAFNAIHMNDRLIDFHCFSILASIIAHFSDVKNDDGSLLELYFSEFYPTFVHALDGTHELQSVASYVIAFAAYVFENKPKMKDEIEAVLLTSLSKIQISSENLTVFCRIVSLTKKLDDPDHSHIKNIFIKASNMLLNDILNQKRTLAELKEELPLFIEKYYFLGISDIPNHIILGLLLTELNYNCNSINLESLTKFKPTFQNDEAIDFILKSIYHSKLIENELKENEMNSLSKNTHLDYAELEDTTFWVVPKRSKSSINNFIEELSINCNSYHEEFILELSMNPPISFHSICLLTKRQSQYINKFALQITSAIIDSIDRNDPSLQKSERLALFKVIIENIPCDIIDKVTSLVASYDQSNPNSKFEISECFEFLRYCIIKLNGYQFQSANSVTTKINNNLFPHGLNFLGSLLTSSRTSLSGVYLLCINDNQLLSQIFNLSISPQGLKSIPRILHLFNLLYDNVSKFCSPNDLKSFSTFAIKIVFIALAKVSSIKERSVVVQPACSLLKKIDKSIINEIFVGGRLQQQLISAVTPPKQAATIQLLTFSNVKSRRSNPGGWQSLDIDDDEYP